MKHLCLGLVLLTFLVFLTFADTGEQEEVDFLLFLPNSGSRFVNENQAMIQLDNVANYLLGRNLNPGQIIVYGYAAAAVNDIEPVNLSRNRALFVINELRKRGVSEELFSDPIAYGSVALWGSNTGEADRSPNRRVRIVLDGTILTPDIVEPVEAEVEIQTVTAESEDSASQDIQIATVDIASADVADDTEAIKQEDYEGKTGSKFPWIFLLLLLIIAAILFLLSRLRKKPQTAKPDTDNKPKIVHEPQPPIAAVPAAASVIAVTAVTSETIVNLDEEIRFRSYELYLERKGQSENAEEDWYRAVIEVCARYEADGYQTYAADGSWWARKSFT
jgi:hypothetical protein